MPETTPLIKAALNLRGGAGFDVYVKQSLVKNWVKLAGLLKKTIGERGKFKKKLECYKAK